MKFDNRIARSAVALAALTISGSALADGASITGTAIYRERIALPESASLEVQLLDVSLMDAPAGVLATTVVEPAGQVPIPFSLTFDSADIESGATYALAARIEADGELWFITDTRHTIDPLSVDMPVELPLARVAASRDPAQAQTSVDGTWRLVEINGQPTDASVASTLILSPGAGEIGGNGGCNTYGGNLEISGASIDIANVFSTMMACDGLSQEQAFFAALEAAESFAATDGVLELMSGDGTVLARLER